MSSSDSPALGTPGPERIRFCPECGEVVAFDERTCSSCGHYEPPLPASSSREEVPCAACGAPVEERLLFCPRCGRERVRELLPGGATSAVDTPAPDGDTRVLDLLTVTLAVVGPLTLMAVVAWVLAYGE